ncbi:MAG: transketolase [Vicingaceae bacterium]|nr:MAG: transketolase [Vicingaceae bacterium]
MSEETLKEKKLTKEEVRQEILNDYRLARISREASILGRKEVLTGKAKFGIFGDGKEVPQIAMAKFFEKGDFRSGYYRDQTFMMAIGELTVEQFFAQLYAHTDVDAEPASAGRSMNGHFATRFIDENGHWKNLTEMKNSSADVSPTASQMPRLLGLAQASKVYKHVKELHHLTQFSRQGREVAFGTIGDASTSEGLFWETINAAGVLQVPMIVSVWDDGHGISVPKKYQTTKESISEVMQGFRREKGKSNGWEIFTVKAWRYPDLIETYEKAVKIAREEHVPVLVHVEDVTQPQGHSTSGSHERYKSPERLKWEEEYCCIRKMKEWIIETGIATEKEIETIDQEAAKFVREAKKRAWDAYQKPIKEERKKVVAILQSLANETPHKEEIVSIINELNGIQELMYRDVMSSARKSFLITRDQDSPSRKALKQWIDYLKDVAHDKYSSHLYSEADTSPLKINHIKPEYAPDPEMIDGRVVLKENFDEILANDPRVLIFGEDSGRLGGVNQALEGLQQKYGEIRVADTGIREATILGQGIGLAMRGLRPIAEIQYLDYLLYALQIMSDDLATVRWRTKGGQMAPVIIRTRGHRLEGIWHSGSPMGMIINGIRGIHVCVPRNMTEAAGFYNTLLKGDDPGLIIEPLNGYRIKEPRPLNPGKYTTPLGVPEILKKGTDLTIVTYGSTTNIVLQAARELEKYSINAEIIDIRTLLPFDIHHIIVESLKKTNRLLIVDEDVPGGASGFIMKKILEDQKGYYYLDSEPKTLTGKEHRPAYASDGDYFSKPSFDDIVEAAYNIMHEANPKKYPI